MNLKRFKSRRAFLLSSISLALSGLFLKVKAQGEATKAQSVAESSKSKLETNARLGINLAGLADWNTEFPFVNFFYMSREWISQPASGAWGSGPALELDEYGWVKALSSDCKATRFICSLENGQYPSGEYVILYDGEGDLKLTFDVGRIVDKKPGRMIAVVNSNKGMFSLDLIKTNPKNYMRNIRVIAPGFEKTHQENPWHPEFLKRWSGISCIRFMDFMVTNNSMQKKWSDRATVKDATFTAKGVPVEMMLDLANRLEADAWLCIPHMADDDYVTNLASYTKKNLMPNLNIWVEYSNEIWNGMFTQARYASEMGLNLKFSDKPWDAGWKFTAHRSIEIFKIYDEVYAGQSGVVKVLASQAGNAYVSEQILSFNHAANYADVLAIAPYVSLNVMPDSKDGFSEKEVADWNLDKLFNFLNSHALPESKKWIEDHKKIANKYHIKLVSYEAGQHMVGVFGTENNEKINKLFFAANADKRMGEVYSKNIAAWESAGGDLICMFNSVSQWSKWGSWGLLRNNQENPKESPKFSTVIKWAISRGQKMSL